MTSRLLLLVTTFGVVVTSCRGDAVDATRTPGTTGSDVVNSVVDVMIASKPSMCFSCILLFVLMSICLTSFFTVCRFSVFLSLDFVFLCSTLHKLLKLLFSRDRFFVCTALAFWVCVCVIC